MYTFEYERVPCSRDAEVHKSETWSSDVTLKRQVEDDISPILIYLRHTLARAISMQAQLFSCGSNGSYHLGLGHAHDVSRFTPASLPPLPDGATSGRIVDLASSSAHTLLVMEYEYDYNRQPTSAGVSPVGSSSHITSPGSSNSSNSIAVNAGGVQRDGEDGDNDAAERFSGGTGQKRKRAKRMKSSSTKSSTRRTRALYGIGTNTFGQLGRQCALRDEADVQVFKSWRRLELVRECGEAGGMGMGMGVGDGEEEDEWEVRKVGVTWTGSLVVYRRKMPKRNERGGGSSAGGGGTVNGNANAYYDQAGGSSASGSSLVLEPGYDSNGRQENEDGNEDDINGDIEEIIIACGSNDFNELGLTAAESSRSPIDSTADGHPHIPVPVTKACAPRRVDLGLRKGEWVEHLKTGQRHVVVVISAPAPSGRGRKEQRVIGWGAGRRGELDVSTLGGLSGPSTRKDERSVRSSTPGTSGNGKTANSHSSFGNGKGKGKGKAVARPTTYPPTTLPLPLSPGETILDLAVGSSHTLVLTSQGRVMGWGSDLKSQIRDVGDMHDVIGIAATWGGSYFLTSDGKVWSQGSNTYGQLLRPVLPGASDRGEGGVRGEISISEGRKVERLVAGSEHLMLLLSSKSNSGGVGGDAEGEEEKDEDAEIWVGGWNEHGNLGVGDQGDRAELVKVDLPPRSQKAGAQVRGLWGGCASSWVCVVGK